MKSGIYRILNLANGKSYVGQTVDMEDRLYKHLVMLRVGTHCNLHLQASFRKYGEGSFEFRILEEVSEDLLDVREQAWIAHYKSDQNQFGYNSDGGGKGNRIVSAECRAKIAASLTGKTHSVETRKKMSASHRKRLGKTGDASGLTQVEMKIEQPFKPFCRPIDRNLPCPPWHRRVIRKSTPLTEEHRAMRQAKRHFSTERGRKISEAKRGWNPSPETRHRMSEGQKARYNNLRSKGEMLQSPEQRVNLSLGAKAHWANYRLNRETKKQTIVLGA